MKQNRVLFDLTAVQENASGKRHGGGKYGEIVFIRMLSRGMKPVGFYRSTRWINPVVLEQAKTSNITLYDLEETSLSEIVEKEKIDIIYSCLPNDSIINFKGCKVKVTVHGLRSLELPFDSYFWKYRSNSFKQKGKFVLDKLLHKFGKRRKKVEEEFIKYFGDENISPAVVSNHTANSAKVYFPQFKDKDVPVFFSPSTSSLEPVSSRKFNEKYFLLVSGNRWEKNNLRAIEAFDNLFTLGFLSEYRVKITGVKTANAYKYKIKNPERFDFVGYVSDEELEQLFHDAYALVYPSLNEGFGYPPLEAMRYGVPVLASSFSSISEVTAGAAMYFNPLSVKEIMNRLVHITSDEAAYIRLSELGKAQYQIITAKQQSDLDLLIDWIYS